MSGDEPILSRSYVRVVISVTLGGITRWLGDQTHRLGERIDSLIGKGGNIVSEANNEYPLLAAMPSRQINWYAQKGNRTFRASDIPCNQSVQTKIARNGCTDCLAFSGIFARIVFTLKYEFMAKGQHCERSEQWMPLFSGHAFPSDINQITAPN